MVELKLYGSNFLEVTVFAVDQFLSILCLFYVNALKVDTFSGFNKHL